MGHLVEDLLTLTRLDEGRPLERGPVDLAELATKVVADARVVEPGTPDPASRRRRRSWSRGRRPP